jgi:MFS family permease
LTGLALLAGPVVGGAIAQGLTWQWIFWINVPIGLLLIPLVLTRFAESFGPDANVDIPGLALVTGAALGLVWGLIRGNAIGWGNPEIVAALAAGALLAVAFVAWEQRAPAPMLPLRFFRSRAFALGNLAGVFLYAALYGALFFFAQFLQTGLEYGPLDAGLRLLPWTATLFVVAPLAGASVSRFGERPLVAGGLALQAVGMGWIGVIAAPDLAYANLVAPLIVAGAGVSMAMPAAQSAVLGAVAKSELGKASGTFNMLRFLGGTFGIAILVAIFAGAGSYASAQTFSNGFSAAIGISAVLSLVGAAAGLGLPSRRATRLVPAGANA